MITAATYWRRRVIALVLGIALFATLAWAANGALKAPGGLAGQERGVHRGHGQSQAHGGGGRNGGPAQAGGTGGSAGHQRPGGTSHASSSPGTGGQHGNGNGGGQAGRGKDGSGGKAGNGTGSQGGPSGNGHGARHGSGDGTGHGTASGTGGRAAATCPARQVVLTLFTPRYWYGQGQRPEFVVTAVSAGTRPCRFSLGQVAVVISTGRTLLWNSTACLTHPQARVTTLTHGVPAALWVSWDRHLNRPACGRQRLARPGTYTATAVGGHLRSPTLIFVLGAPGIAVP